MSLFGKIFKGLKKTVRKVAGVAQFVPGPVGAAARTFNAVDTVFRGVGSSSSRVAAAYPMSTQYQSSYNPAANSLMSLQSLPRLARGAGQLARRAGGAVARNAGTIGTVATAGAILYDAAGNPVGRRKRPRSKGITARELKSFTRVTGLLNKYCKTPPPTKRRSAPHRSKSCR